MFAVAARADPAPDLWLWLGQGREDPLQSTKARLRELGRHLRHDLLASEEKRTMTLTAALPKADPASPDDFVIGQNWAKCKHLSEASLWGVLPQGLA